jgi:6-pyruvoyltetrahydropterin/6-carboxytetrahydropterin synthase
MMGTVTITKHVEFDAGHRVPDHRSKCRSPHGHRYKVEAEITGPVVDEAGNAENGMVIDYGRLKDALTEHVHDPWDHAFLVHDGDHLMRASLTPHADLLGGEDSWKVAVLPCVPTAENLVRVAALRLMGPVAALGGALPGDDIRSARVRLVRVTLWETPTCSAVWHA